MLNTPILKLENINLKIDNFALSNINLDLFRKEIHIIMGENRSVKVYLCRLLAECYLPILDGFRG